MPCEPSRTDASCSHIRESSGVAHERGGQMAAPFVRLVCATPDAQEDLGVTSREDGLTEHRSGRLLAGGIGSSARIAEEALCVDVQIGDQRPSVVR